MYCSFIFSLQTTTTGPKATTSTLLLTAAMVLVITTLLTTPLLVMAGTPYGGTARNIPGSIIEAVDFDDGAGGNFDFTPGCNTNERPSSTIGICLNSGEKFMILGGEGYAEYTLNVVKTGKYNLAVTACRYQVGVTLSIQSGSATFVPNSDTDGLMSYNFSATSTWPETCSSAGPQRSFVTVPILLSATGNIVLRVGSISSESSDNTVMLGVRQVFFTPYTPPYTGESHLLFTGPTLPTVSFVGDVGTVDPGNYRISHFEGDIGNSITSPTLLLFAKTSVPGNTVTFGPPLFPTTTITSTLHYVTLPVSMRVTYDFVTSEAGLYYVEFDAIIPTSARTFTLYYFTSSTYGTTLDSIEFAGTGSTTGTRTVSLLFHSVKLYLRKGSNLVALKHTSGTSGTPATTDITAIRFVKIHETTVTVPGVVGGVAFRYPSSTDETPYHGYSNPDMSLAPYYFPSASNTRVRTDAGLETQHGNSSSNLTRELQPRVCLGNADEFVSYKITVATPGKYTYTIAGCIRDSNVDTYVGVYDSAFQQMDDTATFSLKYDFNCRSTAFVSIPALPAGASAYPANTFGVFQTAVAGDFYIRISTNAGTFGSGLTCIGHILLDHTPINSTLVSGAPIAPGTFDATSFDTGIGFSISSTERGPFQEGNVTPRRSLPIYSLPNTGDHLALQNGDVASYSLWNVNNGLYSVSVSVYSPTGSGTFQLFIAGTEVGSVSFAAEEDFHQTVQLGANIPMITLIEGSSPRIMRATISGMATSHTVYLKSFTFTRVPGSESLTDIGRVVHSVPGDVHAAKFVLELSVDTDILNTGDNTSFRPLSHVDLSNVLTTASFDPQVAVSGIETGEELAYAVSSTTGGFFNVSLFLYSVSDEGGVNLTLMSIRHESMTIAEEFGVAAGGTMSELSFGPYTVSQMYIPVGESLVYVKFPTAFYGATTVRFLGMTFTKAVSYPKRVLATDIYETTTTPITLVAGRAAVLEAEDYLTEAVPHAPTSTMRPTTTLPENNTEYRSLSGNTVRVYKTLAIATFNSLYPAGRFIQMPDTGGRLFYSLNIPASRQINAHVKVKLLARNMGSAVGRIKLTIGPAATFDLRSAINQYASEVYELSPPATTSSLNHNWNFYSNDAYLTVGRGGGTYIVQLTSIVPGQELYIDSIVIEPFDGAFDDTPQTIPGRVEAYKFDNGGETAVITTGSGPANFERPGALSNLYLDENNNITVGDLATASSRKYSVTIEEDGFYDIYFIGKIETAPARMYVYTTNEQVLGPLVISSAGTYADADIDLNDRTKNADRLLGTVYMSKGKGTYLFIQAISNVQFFAALRYIKVSTGQTPATPFLPQRGLLTTRRIGALQFDHGGPDYGYKQNTFTVAYDYAYFHGDSPPATATNQRTGHTLTESHNGTGIDLSNIKSLYYTFKAGTSNAAVIDLQYIPQASSTVSYEFTVQVEQITPTSAILGSKTIAVAPSASTVLTTVTIMPLSLIGGATYRINVGNATSSGTSIISFSIDTTRTSVLPSKCYTIPNLSDIGCTTTETFTTSCTLASTTIAFPGVSSSTYNTCPYIDGGIPKTYTVPTQVPYQPFTGAHMLLHRESTAQLSAILTHSKQVFSVGDVLLESRLAKVVVSTRGFEIYSNIETDEATGAPKRVFISTNKCTDSVVSLTLLPNGGISTATASGCIGLTTSALSQYTFLDGCQLVSSLLHPTTDSNYNVYTYSTSAYKSLYGAQCKFISTSTRDKIAVEYSSGRIESIGAFIPDVSITGGTADGALLPITKETAASPTSLCTGFDATLGMVVVAMKFTPRGTETLKAIHMLSQANHKRFAIGGMAFVKDGDSNCPIPNFGNSTLYTNLATEVEYSATYNTLTTATSDRECASKCSLSSLCKAFDFVGTVCYLYNSLPQPRTSGTTAGRIAGTSSTIAAGISPLQSELPTDPSFHLATTFPSSWSVVTFPYQRGSTFAVFASGVSRVSAFAPRPLFASSADWIYLAGPNVLRQCGNAFNGFTNEPTIFGATSGICTPEDAAVVCGEAEYGEVAEGAFYVGMSSELGSLTTCRSSSGAVGIALKGTLTEAKDSDRRILSSTSLGSSYYSDEARIIIDGTSQYFMTPKTGALDVQLATSNPIGCSFYAAEGYVRKLDTTTTTLDCNSAFSTTVFQDLASACDKRTDCVGIVYDTNPGSASPICLATSTNATASAGFIYYQRRQASTLPCQHALFSNTASVKISVTLTDFEDLNKFVTIAVGDVIITRCGGRYGFYDKTPSSRLCDTTAVCYDGPLHLPKGSVIKVSLSEGISGQFCPTTHVVMTFDSTSQYNSDIPIANNDKPASALHAPIGAAGFVARSIYFQDGSSRSMSVVMKDIESFGIVLENRKESVAAFNNLARLTGRAALVAGGTTGSEQTLSCSTTVAGINSTILTKASTCGGYSVCTGRYGNTGDRQGTFENFPVIDRGEVMFRHDPYPTSVVASVPEVACTDATVRGMLVAKGKPVIGNYEGNYMRVMYAAPIKNGESTISHTRLSNATGWPQSSLSVFPNSVGFQPAFRTQNIGPSARVGFFDVDTSSEATKRVGDFDLTPLLTTTTTTTTPGTSSSPPVTITTTTTDNTTMVPMMACVVDNFMTPASKVCKFNVNGSNYASVYVAQTQFSDSRMYVTVEMEGSVTSVKCGGGNSFLGSYGRSQSCGTYYACYHGPTTGTEITVSISSPYDAAFCNPAATALVVPRNVDPINCSSDRELACSLDQKCLPLEKMCDGVPDCSDAGDEAFCAEWRLVSKSRQPRCSPIATWNSTGVLSFDQCRSYAAIKILNKGLRTMSVMFRENTYCKVYSCVDADNAIIELQPYNGTGFYYSRLESISDYSLCTADLHCSGKGTVSSTRQPCTCTCIPGFAGISCEAKLDMTAVTSIAFATDKSLTALQRQSTKNALDSALRAAGLGSGEVVLTDFGGFTEAGRGTSSSTSETTTTSGAIVATRDFHTMSGASTIAYYEAKVSGSSATAGVQSAALTELLNSRSVRSLNQTFADNGLQLVDLSAPSLLRQTQIVFCNISVNSTTIATRPCDPMYLTFGEEDFNTTGMEEDEVTKRRRERESKYNLVEYTATFYGALSGYTFQVEDGVTCTDVSTLQADATLLCTQIRTCRRSVMAGAELVVMRPAIVYPSLPTGTVGECTNIGGDSELIVEVSYAYIKKLPSSSAKNGDTVGEESGRTAAADSALTNLYILAAVTVVLAVIAFGVIMKGFRYIAALVATFLSVSMMGVILFGVTYYDGTYSRSTHYGVVSEFRSSQCVNSSISPIPHRIGRVISPGGCSKVEAFGTSEGALFMSVDCGAVIGDTVRVRVASSLKECESKVPVTVERNGCIDETVIRSNISDSQAEYVQVNCFSAAEGDALFRLVSTSYRPNLPLVEETNVDAVPAVYQTRGTADKEIYFRGGLFVEQDIPHIGVGSSSEGGDDPATKRQPVFGVLHRSSSVVGTVPVQYSDINGELETPSVIADSSTHNIHNVTFDFNVDAQEERDYALEAMRYQKIDVVPPLDFGSAATEDSTMTMWMKLDASSSGFVFATTDNWEVSGTYESPIISRIVEIMQNGLSTDRYFSNNFHMYMGLYASGPAKTLSLVYASPTSTGDGVVVKEWDMTGAKVKGEDVFDGNWHFIAIAMAKEKGSQYAQLFIDGRTSYVEEGWRVCFDDTPKPYTELPDRVNVQGTDERVKKGGTLYIGHINSPVWNLRVHSGLLLQEKIIALGSPDMKRHNLIDVDNSLLLGGFLATIALLGLVLSFVLVVVGKWRSREYELKKSKFEDKNDIGKRKSKASGGVADPGRRVVAKLRPASKSTGGSSSSGFGHSAIASAKKFGAGISSQATTVSMMIPPVLMVGQNMAVYISSWQWPYKFSVNIGNAVWWLSFDINLSFPAIPAMVTPAIQVFVAFAVFFFILAVLSQDNALFVEKINNPANLPDPTEEPSLQCKATLKFDHVTYTISDPLQMDEFLDRAYYCVKRRGKPVVVKVAFDETVADEEGVKEPTTLYLTGARTDKDNEAGTTSNRRQITCKINDVYPDGDNSPDKDTHDQFAECIVVLDVVGADVCPMHGDHLIRAHPSVHNCVKKGPDDESPYCCAYESHTGVLYRSLKDDDVLFCPGRTEEFYVCSDDTCSYTVCDKCYEGGAVSKLKATIASNVYSIRRFGIFPIIGFIMLTLAQMIHMPVMKNALMIIWCHVDYQCMFPDCYQDPTSTYLTFVAFAVLIVLALGVGFTLYLYYVAFKRKRYIMESFPVEGSSLLFSSLDRILWDELLMADNSLLKKLYEPYDFRWMWVHATTLVLKLLVVAPVVFTAPNSLTQLAMASTAESVALVFWIATNPFSDYWVGFLTHISSVHQVGQLALMCFSRVAISKNPDDETYGYLMIYLAVSYLVVLVIVIVFGIIVPTVLAIRATRQEREELCKAAEDAAAEEEEAHRLEEEEEMKGKSTGEAGSPLDPNGVSMLGDSTTLDGSYTVVMGSSGGGGGAEAPKADDDNPITTTTTTTTAATDAQQVAGDHTTTSHNQEEEGDDEKDVTVVAVQDSPTTPHEDAAVEGGDEESQTDC